MFRGSNSSDYLCLVLENTHTGKTYRVEGLGRVRGREGAGEGEGKGGGWGGVIIRLVGV